MNGKKIAGLSFFISALGIQIPYTYLIQNFRYPDILRESPAFILQEFAKGGEPLVYAWFFFAILGLPLFYGYSYLDSCFSEDRSPLRSIGFFLGCFALVVQWIGLMRWVFLVPILANLHLSAPPENQWMIETAFQVQHILFGVILGEHIGQFFTVLWIWIYSYEMWSTRRFGSFLPWFGAISGCIYLLGQSELLSLVTSLPEIPMTGFLGSLGWLFWMMGIGYRLLREPKS
ncbi:MAG: DUF4386 domain-containing protein [Leptospira sp.]|nr:DUF4386 domain-containing protein [Leptospira sp.]